MELNQAGLDLIKSFEGCRLEAYQDMVGIWTIGYGHTGDDVYSGQVITQEEADEILRQDLQCFCDGVAKLLTVKVEPNQFAALVAFAYNVGLANLKVSTLLRCINKHNAAGAAGEFMRWNHAGGVIVPGLTRRREAERTLFMTE